MGAKKKQVGTGEKKRRENIEVRREAWES